MATRKETADLLKKMVVMHWVKKGYSCFVEQGLNRNGRLRGDVVAMNLYGRVIITEIKSCKADLSTDTKWYGYREFADQLYMAWPNDFGVELPPDVGLILPNSRGHMTVKRRAKIVPMKGTVRKSLIIRLAWRAGTFSKRNTIRTKVFIQA